jgi:hypothetical protein
MLAIMLAPNKKPASNSLLHDGLSPGPWLEGADVLGFS